jgi:hypothetical protein
MSSTGTQKSESGLRLINGHRVKWIEGTETGTVITRGFYRCQDCGDDHRHYGDFATVRCIKSEEKQAQPGDSKLQQLIITSKPMFE